MNLLNPPTKGKVYALVEPDTDRVRYVGWTVKRLRDRLKAHLKDKYPCHKVNWIRSLQERGLTPEIRLIQIVPFQDWEAAERYWIAEYRKQGCDLTNATDGGDGGLGCPHSEETKIKLRLASLKQFESAEARAAVSLVHKGKTISPEHRKIVSDATKRRWAIWRDSGCVTSEETRAKISAARKRRSISAEQKAKISQSLKGRILSADHKAKIGLAHKGRARSAQ